jgi:hypothetical protein
MPGEQAWPQEAPFHTPVFVGTVAELIGSQGRPTGEPSAGKKRMADAEARLRRFQAAIAAGIDPAALVEVINTAQAERAAAPAELDNVPAQSAIKDGSTERLATVYAACHGNSRARVQETQRVRPAQPVGAVTDTGWRPR